MYQLPDDFDVMTLKGLTLESVAYAHFQVNLYFTGGIWIQIESGYLLEKGGVSLEEVHGFPIMKSMLMALVGMPVSSAYADESSALSLELEDWRLTINSQNEGFEAYCIFDGRREIFI